ncbi:MAG: DUF4394 domain-containing protein, partial [Chloroflexota bacterium]|nr:DUF4394 domain-containing protein [Chloroflexota bacterium]
FAPIDTFPEQITEADNSNVLVGNFVGDQEGVVELASDGSVVAIYDPPEVGGYRGVYELPNGNILTTNAEGVHEIDRDGNLVETKISGVSARYIEFTGALAAIELEKTVGSNPAVCADSDEIVVEEGSEVVYCYEVTNTGSITFTLHDLVDSELGTLLDDFSLTLTPGESVFVTESATINETTVNTATWTAYNPGPTNVATSSDTATVYTVQPGSHIALEKTVGTDPSICATTDVITVTLGAEVTYCYEVTNTGNVTLTLHDLEDSELGTLLDDFSFTLAPGASVSITESATLSETATNTATWTAFNAGLVDEATATDTATVNVEPTANIRIEPDTLSRAQAPDTVTTETLTIRNTGNAPLVWEIVEEQSESAPLRSAQVTPLGDPAESSLEAVPTHFGAATTQTRPTGELLGAASAFGVDLVLDSLVSFTTDAPGTLDTVGPTSGAYFGGDFMGNDFSTLYAVNNDTDELVAIDTATAAETIIGSMVPASGQTWSGMAGDPATDTMYAISSNCTAATLYTVDLDTGEARTVADISDATCLIALAASSDGQLYAVDILLDALVQIDKNTGVGTVIGSLGFNANFAQGADFDHESGILYLAAFNAGTEQAELRIADTSTGNTTLVGPLGSGSDNEVDALGIATAAVRTCEPTNIPWISVMPNSGTTAPGSAEEADVVFDSSSLEPGTYTGNLCIASNDPDESIRRVPITLTVESKPSAVTLNSLAAQPRSLPLPGKLIALLTLGLAAAVGLVMHRRRRA